MPQNDRENNYRDSTAVPVRVLNENSCRKDERGWVKIEQCHFENRRLNRYRVLDGIDKGRTAVKGGALNLILFALAILETLYFWGGLHLAGLFPLIGADFRALYAAAQAARAYGFAAIYDPARTFPFQQALCRMADPQAPCVFIPMVFLPAFVLPILPLTFLPPAVAFALGSGMSFLLIFLALWPFLRPFPPPERRRLLAMMGLSYPAFMNLLWGQVSAWLLLSVARFQIHREARADLRSGLWLGGLLLKPQMLILLLPGLAIAGQWAALAGFGISTGFVLALSLALSGPEGLWGWWGWISGFARPHPALAPAVVGAETMMNWRGLGAVSYTHLTLPTNREV